MRAEDKSGAAVGETEGDLSCGRVGGSRILMSVVVLELTNAVVFLF